MERIKRNAGFTLIEILIALVIISVVLLALVKIQLIASSGVNSASQREQAVLYMSSIFENMRANKTQALNGNYNISLNESSAQGNSIAKADLIMWKNNLDNLVEGKGSVSVQNGRASVLIQWKNISNQKEESDIKQIRMNSEL